MTRHKRVIDQLRENYPELSWRYDPDELYPWIGKEVKMRVGARSVLTGDDDESCVTRYYFDTGEPVLSLFPRRGIL